MHIILEFAFSPQLYISGPMRVDTYVVRTFEQLSSIPCVSIHSPGCSQFFVITNGAAITTFELVQRVSESTPGMYTLQCHRQIRGSVAAPT